ncbi:hypothetical protein [Lysobacter sp. Root604]|uniref:hypothetical protein n=1 Tax=Lysobacter sp. Root604 TaxID=1736568 RepID=UPI0006F26E68|nr:hypothetical protein [Lysobacter sp. Root604]KRA20394.1 hypothetical protein ASD69_03360 [Lysobacter sp. Root604]
MALIKRHRAVGALAIFLALSSGQAWSQDKPAVLMFDDSMDTVSGARMRLGFERLPAENEHPVWTDGSLADDVAVALLAGGGLVGGGIAEARKQEQRNDSIAPLRQAMERGDRLRLLIDTALEGAVRGQGYTITQTVRSNSLSQGAVSRILTKPEDGMGIAVQRTPAVQLVTLSWDNRQLFLAMDLRFYKHGGGVRMPIREKGRRVVRYVGPQSPTGVDPLAYWSAQDGTAFLAQVELGLQHLLPLVWDETLDIPNVSRKDTTMLQIGQGVQTFPGRLWKQEGGYAYLYNKDGGVTVVATEPAQVAAGQ